LCPGTEWREVSFPRIAEGSEHIVFLEANLGRVWKLTRPKIFGESYYLVEGIVHQKNSSPLEYLVRLKLWTRLFGTGPGAVGVTKNGQIVSVDSFVPGTPPSQERVDAFLVAAGLVPAKQSCWLWKKEYLDLEIWVGDARADNFVETARGIVPIDIRLWAM
jgi:hypothetical protein